MRRASAPLGASADQDVTVHVHAIRPIHQPISRCLPRARTQCPRKMLPLATRDGQGVVCGCFSFPAKREWSTSLDEDLWARGGARSSFAAEIVLWTIRGTPHSHLPLKCERPRLYFYSFSHLIGAGPGGPAGAGRRRAAPAPRARRCVAVGTYSRYSSRYSSLATGNRALAALARVRVPLRYTRYRGTVRYRTGTGNADEWTRTRTVGHAPRPHAERLYES